MYVTVILGTTADKLSSYCMLAIDFSLNLWSTAKIIKLNRKIHPKLSNKTQIVGKIKGELLSLAIIEAIEMIVPLAYLFTLLFAYYGPNANIIGNIKGGYWTNTKIDDIEHLVVSALEIFSIDLSSAIIGGILLWKICSIDLALEIYTTMKCYWHLIALKLATDITAVCTSYFLLIT
jgi:hypothetical protein